MKLYLHTLNEIQPNRTLKPYLAEHDGGSTFIFDCPNEEALLSTLEALVAELPASLLDEACVLLSSDCTTIDPALALSGVMAFNTFYARHRHPWLLTDLATHVKMHFQPIVDFTQSGRIFGYEALCRLEDPSGTLLSGEEAFKLASQVKRASELDSICQMLALEGKARSIAPGVPVFINVLPQTIMLETLNKYGIEQRDVVIEVIESEEVKPELLPAIATPYA
ncbi:MAG TPA: EAL domain-containing protein [Methylophilaceae bacterium]|nr:EAL domain-containing protein [Methylophilaceae bacterium]